MFNWDKISVGSNIKIYDLNAIDYKYLESMGLQFH